MAAAGDQFDQQQGHDLFYEYDWNPFAEPVLSSSDTVKAMEDSRLPGLRHRLGLNIVSGGVKMDENRRFEIP